MIPDDSILLISDHRQFGPVAGLWEVAPDAAGWYVLHNRVNRSVLADNEHPDGVIHKIVALTQTFSDSEIHRRFTRKGTSLKDFMQNISPELLSLQVRPFIDRQLDQVFRLALANNLPVFIYDGSQRAYYRNRLQLTPETAEPWFCFTKTADGSNYVLEIYQDEKKILLKSPGNKIICRNPCWFMAGNRLIHLPEGFDGKKTEPFLTRDAIQIAASAEKKYFETFILKTLKTGHVRASGFKVESLEPLRRMELSAEFDWQGKAVLVVWFRYGDQRIMAGKQQKVFIDLRMNDNDVVFYRTQRDPDWEGRMISVSISAGLIMYNENSMCLPESSVPGDTGMYFLIEWLNENATFFSDEGILILTDRAPRKYFTGNISAVIRVEPGEDWFDVKASVFFGSLEISFVHLRRYILERISEFPLPGGETAVLPSEWFTRYGDLHYFSDVAGDHLRLSLHHVRLIRALELPMVATVSERLNQLDPQGATPVDVPVELRAVLRPYQEEGLQWLKFLHENRFGGCLADDMGLGKTIQTLALLLLCHMESRPASLVVMPASLIHNWRNEIRRFAPSLTVLEHTGINRMTSAGFFSAANLVLTTYGTLRNDLALFLQYRFHYIILDESQVIKNPAAQISKAVCMLKGEHRLVLTGTPIENSLTDLWSQLEFLNPGMLGSLAMFQKRYAAAGPEASDLVSERLKQIVAPFILRRTKREAEPDLPSLTVEEWYCEMTESQRSRYEKEKSAVRNEVLQQFESGRATDTSLLVLKALIRLRQMANHPKLADPGYDGNSGKFEEIMRVAHNLREEGHKTLIFSSFVKHLMLIAAQFDLENIPYSMLTGATVRREDAVKKFRESAGQQFFLISLKAGGTGLNLTEAGYVMMLDPWWNPATEMQAINRAHRIGQDKKVIAYKFISAGTIEEKMLLLQQRKQALSDTFLPSGNPLKDLSRDEIAELFG